MENIFDNLDDEVSAPAASTLVRGQENLFDEFDNDPPPPDLGPNSSTHLKSTPGPLPAWQQQMIDGVSISNAREAAKVLTKAERDNPRMETPEESASFFGAFQNGLGPQNYAAFADMLDHLGDMRGDKGMHDWADGIRKSLEEDKSSYKAIYQSYKQIRGLSSAWDYAKESAGQMLGVMTPSLAGGFMGGLGGGAIGSRLGGKTGAAVGGAMGGIAGAASGSIHLHVSEMRGALKREGMEGENLVDYTNYGAAVLASLDALFPGLAMARAGGFARKKLAEGVASKLAENLAKGGKLVTIAEFNKQFGKQLAKDTLLEVTTELAQQAVTDLGAKRLAGKEITKGDLEKFAYETAPEIALRTAIGTAFVGAGPSAIQAGKTLSEARAKVQAEQQSPGDRKADKLVTDQGDVVDPAEAPPPAPVDGTPAVDELAAQQPAVEDASREAPAPVDQRQKGDSVLRFIRDSGGLQPSGELDALDAQRYPGLINENGLTADQMREVLIENGYLEETGPDAPSVTTPQDVYDLVQRAISGERIVPLADQKADDAHFSGPDDGDARRALLQNEKQFVLPQIEQYDEEFGEPVLAKVYRGLKEDDRLEVIDRVRRGEDVADLLEEVSMREADVEALQEMTAKRGPDPQVVERIREMIAQQQPDLLTGFDEVVAAMPARRPRAARGSLNLRAGEHPGDRSMAELMQMSKAELSSAAARSGVPARPNWSKERIAGELRAAAARRLTPEPARELKMGEMPDKPAVPVKFSVTPAAIVSLIDGSKHTDIRPHLKQRGVTLEQYARQFDLPPDYPVLAPNEVDRRYDVVRTTVSDDEFAKQFTIGAELAPSESAGEAEAAPQPEKPQRDTAAEFLRLLAGRTPRAQWASSLGVTEKELKPQIDRALAKGLLRRDRNGVIRRNPAALKEFEPETEIVNQKIERAVEQGAAAMVAPGRIEGADVAMTPAAIDRAAEIKGVVTRALAGILPRDVRVDVVDTIEIGRLAREDELLSLRSSKSATVDEGTEGESDGVQKDSGDSGKARDDKSEPADAGAIAAAVGGGDVPGSSAAEGRILRQESATLRDDGSIRAGRISGKARGAVSRGRNAETLQPVGTAEFFDAPGFRGVVTAGAPADHALLDRRGAPPSEYRLATLTYRLYDENAPMTEAQLKNFQPNFRAGGEFHAPLIWARVSQHMDGTWEVSMIQRIAAVGDAPRGMSSKLYAAIEADLGIRMSPSGILSKEGLAMWQKRSPESVKWHQWSKHEQYFISPRRIKDNIDRIGKELAAIAARPDSDETKAIDLKSARKERGELIKLWGQLPLEARAATPDMFSLRQSPDQPRTPTEVRVYHGTPSGGIDRFDPARANLEAEGAAFFTPNQDAASSYSGEQWFDTMFGGDMQPTIYPTFIETKDFKTIDFKGQTFNDGIGPSGKSLNDEIALAKKEGHPGLIVKNVEDTGGLQDQYVTWTKGTVRSALSDQQMFALRGFYSPAIRAAESISMKKGTGEQFLKQITKAPGVRKDELEWMGLEEFLKDKPSVTRDEVLSFMRAHQVELDEKALTDRPYSSDEIGAAVNHIAKAEGITAAEVLENWGYDRNESYVGLAQSEYGFDIEDRGVARYMGHKVPGGQNYRELLIRLPALKGGGRNATDAAKFKAIDAQILQLQDDFARAPGGFFSDESNAISREIDRLTQERDSVAGVKRTGYTSKHFQDQEIVHLRVDDRTGPNGEKVLFINEVQSDLHQAGRQSGYGSQNIHARAAEARAEIRRVRDEPDFRISPEREEELTRIIDEADALNDETGSAAKIPNAPFKGDLWLELALKRALLYASENGYDAISWARSDQIAKAVGAEPEKLALQYDQKIGRFLDKYTKKWGAKVEEGAPSSSRGAEIERRFAELGVTIDDLEFGPSRFSREQQVEIYKLIEERSALKMAVDFTPGEQSNPILRITPEMRASVMEGQPLALRGREDTGQLEALGQTDLYSQTISIAVRAVEAEARRTGKSMAKVATQAARHEALEFFQGIGLIRPQEWANLRAAAIADNWIDETSVRDAYTAKYGSVLPPAELEELILKEAIMEKYGAYERGEFAPKGIVRKVMERVKNFLQSVMNGLRGLGFERWEDIFQKVDAGELRKRYEAIYGEQKAAPVAAPSATTASPQPMIRAGQIPDARGQTPTPGQSGEVKGIAELIDEFKRAIGLTARTGRLDPGLKRAAKQAGGELLGQYNGVARTKIQGDIDTLTHEGGHHLERTLGADLAAIMRAHQAELTPLATSLGNPLSEGFAEFFRRYVTNPTAAAARAPGFFRDFEDLLDANNPEMLEQLQSIQREYDRFLLGDPVEQGIANQTVVKRTQNAFSKGLSDIERDGFVSTIGDRLHTLYYNLISQNHGWWIAVRDLLGDIEARTGQRISLAAKDNPNKLIRMISHTAAWAQQDLKDGIALRGRPNGGGVSMHQVLATAFGGTDKSQWNERATQEFGEYLIARRAIHQYVRFRPAFRQQIQQFVAANPSLAFILQRLPNNLAPELERPPTKESLTHQLMKLKALEERQPQFRQAAELYYAFNRDIIRFLHEKQLITKEERDEYLRDRDYAPFQRDMSDKEPARGEKSASKRPGRAADTANKNDVYRRFEGSMRDIINPIQSTSQLVYEMRLRAAINDTLLAMDRLADQAGPAGKEIFERVPAHEAKAMHVNMREALRQAAKAAGMSPTDTAVMLTNVEGQIGQNVVTTMFTQQKAGERGERIVWFYKDGEAVPAQIADGELGRMMFEGLTANGYRNMDLLTKILSFPANIVRFGVTASFEFIFRNIFVDSIVAPINSPYSRSILTAAAGAKDIARGGRSHQLYNRYAGMLGGEFSTSISDQSIQRDVEALRRKGFKVRMPKNALDLFRLVFTGLGEASESSTRVGIFRNAMQSAIADGMSEHDAAIEAAHYAHDVMDFSRHGSKTETLRRTIPFWNAAIQGMDKYFRTLAGANDYGTLIGIWQRYRAGQPLSLNEQKAVGQAARAWALSTVVLGGVSLLFAYLGEDDEDQDEITDQLRATHWRVSLDGILYLLPKSVKTFMNWDDDSDITVRLPKPFEIAWFANGVERAYDGAKKGDKTAFEGWLKDFWSGIAPPDSMPGLDLTYGFLTGKDLYSGRDIIPTWEKDLERPEQFGPYTTETARRIGKSVNMSPYYVDYLVRGVGASLGRDVTTLIDIAAQKGPTPSIEEYPIARRFTYNTGRNSKSIGKFYDMTSDKEGLNAWFWDAVSSDARSFNAAANTYKRLQDAKKDSAAADYLNRINPDQRVFAILSADFERGKAKLRNLHPIINAQEAITVTNNLMKEVVDGTLLVGKKGEERKPIDREQARFARNEIGHIRKGIAQNALRTLEIEGWAQQKLMDVDARIATLKAGAPEVHAELLRRLKAKDVQKFSHIAQVWSEVRRRVLQDKGEAQISDLAYGKVEGY